MLQACHTASKINVNDNMWLVTDHPSLSAKLPSKHMPYVSQFKNSIKLSYHQQLLDHSTTLVTWCDHDTGSLY